MTKNVGDTKMIFFTIVRGAEKREGCELRSVPGKNLLHSSYCGVVASYDNVVFGIQGVEPCLK